MAQPKTIDNREYSKFVESPTRPNNSAVEVVLDTVKSIPVSYFGEYDEVQATYPTLPTELYTYKLSTVSIGSILVTYTDSGKNVLSSVIYNVI